jgi:hypothetical protein
MYLKQKELFLGTKSLWAKCPKSPSSMVERRMGDDPKDAPVPPFFIPVEPFLLS